MARKVMRSVALVGALVCVTNGSGPTQARSGPDGSDARLVATDGHIAPAGSTSAAAGSAAAAPAGLAAYNLGVLGQPTKVIGRDGGYTTKIGGEILWGFGDTLFYGPAADGSSYRTNSGAHNVPGYPPRRTPRLVGSHGGTSGATVEKRGRPQPGELDQVPHVAVGQHHPGDRQRHRLLQRHRDRPVRDHRPRRRHRHRRPRRHQSNPREHPALHAERVPVAQRARGGRLRLPLRVPRPPGPRRLSASRRLPAHRHRVPRRRR